MHCDFVVCRALTNAFLSFFSQLYTLVSHVDVKDFKGLQTETVEA